MTDQTHRKAGYANPPTEHRFKKGKSGNPRGRPRKENDLWSHLDRVLRRKVKLQGSDMQMPIREALIRRLRELALAGDRRALEMQRRILAEAGAGDISRFDPEETKRNAVKGLNQIAEAMKKREEGGDG